MLTLSSRHQVSTIKRGITSETNTVAESWVPMIEEIEAVAQGDGVRLSGPPRVGGTMYAGGLFAYRGRTYVVEANGHVYPFGGPGLHRLTRQEYIVLKALVSSGGNEDALRIIRAKLGEGLSPDRLEFLLRFAAQAWGSE